MCVCDMVFRAFETKSNGLLLLPLQDIHLSLSLWPAGLWWYIFICYFVWCVCVHVVGEWMRGLVMSICWECRVHAAYARHCCCRSMCMANKKIIQVIRMQMNEASLSRPFLRVSSASWGRRPGGVELFSPMASPSDRKTRVSLLLGPWCAKNWKGLSNTDSFSDNDTNIRKSCSNLNF